MLIKMDVIRCPVSAGLNFRGTKLSRMAVEPRKPRKFSTAKIKVHTVVYKLHLSPLWMPVTSLPPYHSPTPPGTRFSILLLTYLHTLHTTHVPPHGFRLVLPRLLHKLTYNEDHICTASPCLKAAL